MARRAVRGASRAPRARVLDPRQVPLFLPDSGWVRPASPPDLRGRVDVVAIDVENRDEGLAAGRGSSWFRRGGHVCGVGVAWREGAELSQLYLPVAHPDSDCLDGAAVGGWLRDLCAPGGPRVATHHGSHDWGWLWSEWGVGHAEGLEDSEAAAVMADENRLSYKLGDLCRWRGLPGKDEVLLREAAAAYGYEGDDAVKGNIWRFPARFVGPYGGQDPASTLLLLEDLSGVLETEGTAGAYRLEMDLVPVVHEMRRRGVRVDLEACASARVLLRERRDAVLRELSDLLGRRAGMQEARSVKFLEAAHDNQKISYPRTAKTGQGSFTKEWMEGHDHWLPRLVCRAQELDAAEDKFLGSYVEGYAHRGRLHATVNQFRGEEGGTRSHRFSYSDPPLQQAPARDDELAPLFRGCFLPEEGETWLSADWSQQELRRMVHYAELMGLPRAAEIADLYRSDPATDFHQVVVDWTGLERKPAKNASFAKSYGASRRKFALMIGRPEEEASEVYERYDRELPFVQALADRCQRLAERRGYVRLSDGARSHFDLWEPARWDPGRAVWGSRPLDKAKLAWPGERLRRADCRKAMNRLIQGTCARVAKAAIVACSARGLVPLLQMHDELCFSVASRDRGELVGKVMREVDEMTIPSRVDLEYGRSWGDAKHAWEDMT